MTDAADDGPVGGNRRGSSGISRTSGHDVAVERRTHINDLVGCGVDIDSQQMVVTGPELGLPDVEDRAIV